MVSVNWRRLRSLSRSRASACLASVMSRARQLRDGAIVRKQWAAASEMATLAVQAED